MEMDKRTVREEVSRCLLCHDARCSAACPAGLDTASFIRSLRFDDAASAAERMRGAPCAELCADRRRCELACTRRAVDRPVRITALMQRTLADAREPLSASVDLSIDFLGVRCENPFFLASSPAASSFEMVARAFDAGWAGAFYKTIGFYVAQECSPRFDMLGSASGWSGFKNMEQISERPTQENIDSIARLKQRYPEKIIVASIMGSDEDEWRRLAVMCEQAGADMLEGNFSCPQMAADGMGSDVGVSPELVARYTAAAAGAVRIPFIAKMTPNVTDITIPAAAAISAGARGIAAINTVRAITNVDLRRMVPRPNVGGRSSISGLSGAAIKPIALRYAAEIASSERCAGAELSGIGGVETWRDAAELIALGCRTVQVSTSVMQYGYRIIDDLRAGLARHLQEQGLSSVSELVGRALPNVVSPDSLDRSYRSMPIFDAERCIGCGRCRVSCSDGSHCAIDWDPAERRPSWTDRCVGCGLCALVCPVECITMPDQ